MKIMVVDHDKGSRDTVKSFLLTLGHDVVDFENGQEALEALTGADVSLILADVKMPQLTGIDLVRAISASHLQPKPHVALFTGYGTMDSVMEALRAGAIDYLLKPVNAKDIASVINRVANFTASVPAAEAAAAASCRQILLGTAALGVFSPIMESVVHDACTYHTDRNISVLVRGETGTGKELVARLIHFGNQHDQRPFIDINCAAITPSLFESELFGYESGAFTGGRIKGQKGKVDLAQGGTLFLDEVAEIPLELQGKLLRFIQEKTFYRVGGLKRIEADVRIICATNRNLEQAVSEGRFRSDLYYRLKVGQIFIPPLRERPEEILALTQFFLEKFTVEKNKKFRIISKKAGDILMQYDWPGNVRELSNIIEVATTMFNTEELLPEHLHLLTTGAPERKPDAAKAPEQTSPPPEKITGELLLQALAANRGNKTNAAKYLGISRRSLYRLLNRLDTNFREEDNRFQLCLNSMKDSVTLFKALRNQSGAIIDFTCDFVNEAACLMYGRPREELAGQRMQEIWPASLPEIFDECRSICETGKPATDQRFHCRGEVNSQYERHVFKLGDGVGVIIRDITGSHQPETEIKQPEDHYRALMDITAQTPAQERFQKAFYLHPHLMMIISLQDNTYMDVNTAFCRTMGLSRDEIIGRKVDDLNLWYDLKERQEVLKQLRLHGCLFNHEIRYRSIDNEMRIGLLSTDHTTMGEVPCTYNVIIDITDKKRLEEEMHRFERLNLVGQMAAGIGHEVRNPLTVVRGYLQMMQSKPDFNAYIEQISLMVAELDRANLIITDYLSLAKNKTVNLRTGNLNSVLVKLFPLLQADAFNSDNSIQLDTKNIRDFNFDENEIRQLILNLTRNSLDAMQHGGKVTIKTYCEDNHVVLAVQDTGTGISDAIIDKIGTPFITTKEKGTGLGLAVCYQIAQRHGAKLSFKTSSSGTTFFVTFPL